MSAANPTTHPASTSNARSGRPSRGAMEDASDLKALHSKYAGSVKTLKELFPDWTEDDLIFALEETEGDLEDTINHITEGHAAKWGEVKSRKEKRQAAKPKLQHRDEPRSADKTSHVPRPASFRGGIRGGAPRGGRSANTHVGARTKPAAAAAAPAVPVASASEGSGWDLAPADDNSNADSWGAEAAKPAAKPAAAAPADTAAAPAKASSMSWANIAKR
ncbi:RNAPII degradation factor [Coemansia spiralis]|nr:RNAPII degradation factor [Coemansia spiralis]